jgi:hypothetical protein
VEELGLLVPLLPGLRRREVVAVLRLELLLVVGPLEGGLVPEHDVDVTVVRHADDLPLVPEHQLLVDVGDVVHDEVELQLLDPGLERLQVSAIVGHERWPEHDEIPRALAAVELEQRLGHVGVERDHLGLDLDAELVVDRLLDEGERVLHVLGVHHGANRGALVGPRRLDLGHGQTEPRRQRADREHHRQD